MNDGAFQKPRSHSARPMTTSQGATTYMGGALFTQHVLV
jgi:hypothetical protein